MKSRLHVIAGPFEGMTFALSGDEITVGREIENEVCLPDLSISRKHFSIKKDGDQIIISDLGSLNATIVNELPVREHRLKSGDRIRAGDSLLLFLIEEDEAPVDSSTVKYSDVALMTNNTVLLRKSDAEESWNDLSQSSEVHESVPSRSTRDLNALLKISQLIGSFRRPEIMLDHILNQIGSVIPADRGAVLLSRKYLDNESAEGNFDDFVPACGWKRKNDSRESIYISRTVSDRVRTEGVSILSNDILMDIDLRVSTSLVERNVIAILATPIIINDQVQGLFYLDVVDNSVQFDPDHLQLMQAVTDLAAMGLENLRRLNRLEYENQTLRAEISIEHNMVGNSPRMRDVYQLISKVAPSDATVLIRGESGTGKELAARAIHFNSHRSNKTFLGINCAALTDTLLESELFGHEKGAFTGATSQKKGKLEVAEGGTVFLDEIGEMSTPLQSKLLRVLQEHEFERVGGTRTIKTDIRLIAATNRNLELAIKEGRFREDLYYRLNVVGLNLPPLRERREDIFALGHYFAGKYGQKCKRRINGISPEAMSCMMNYEWPGNVRELENALERAVVLGSSDEITIEDLPEAVIESKSRSETDAGRNTAVQNLPQNFYEAVNEMKKRIIKEAFERTNGSYIETARLLGVHPNHLHRLIRNLNMKEDLQ